MIKKLNLLKVSIISSFIIVFSSSCKKDELMPQSNSETVNELTLKNKVTADANNSGTASIAARVKRVIAEKLGDPDIEFMGNETNLIYDLGADELDMIEIDIEMEKEFLIDIYDEDAEKLLTIGDYISFCAQRLGTVTINGSGGSNDGGWGSWGPGSSGPGSSGPGSGGSSGGSSGGDGGGGSSGGGNKPPFIPDFGTSVSIDEGGSPEETNTIGNDTYKFAERSWIFHDGITYYGKSKEKLMIKINNGVRTWHSITHVGHIKVGGWALGVAEYISPTFIPHLTVGSSETAYVEAKYRVKLKPAGWETDFDSDDKYSYATWNTMFQKTAVSN